MKNLNTLLKIIDNESILLEEVDFIHTYMEGIYFKVPGLPPTIGIKKSITSDEKKYISVLAEELGHHFTTIGDLTAECFTYSDKIVKNKKELLAKRWATNFLISDSEFVNALYSCTPTIYDLSEYFNVTEEIIKYKMLFISYDEFKYINIINNFMLKEIQYKSCCV